MESFDPLLLYGARVGTGDDGHRDSLLCFAPTGNLGCISSAEFCISWESESGQTLKDGAFARRLITGDNQLMNRALKS